MLAVHEVKANQLMHSNITKSNMRNVDMLVEAVATTAFLQVQGQQRNCTDSSRLVWTKTWAKGWRIGCVTQIPCSKANKEILSVVLISHLNALQLNMQLYSLRTSVSGPGEITPPLSSAGCHHKFRNFGKGEGGERCPPSGTF